MLHIQALKRFACFAMIMGIVALPVAVSSFSSFKKTVLNASDTMSVADNERTFSFHERWPVERGILIHADVSSAHEARRVY